MNIADICTRELVMAEKDSSLQQAATLMREHHVGTLVVVDGAPEGRQVVGIVTDRDVVIEAVARGLDVARAGIERETAERAPLPAAQPPSIRIPAYSYV